jgi:endonuclease YncB( thermonuclease family)
VHPGSTRIAAAALGAVVAAAVVALVVRHGVFGSGSAASGWDAVDHVSDGDTIVLRGGATVRLVQIDTPEVYFAPECFGEQASAETKRLLPPGTPVRLVSDPETDSTDIYGRLLRYVIRRDGLNVNLRLVADGAAAPYFFEGVRGEYAATMLRSAYAARAARMGLWGACPSAELRPDEGVSTGPAAR